jgi:hypothetical protein
MGLILIALSVFFSGLTGTRTLSIPSTPLPDGTIDVSTGKSVIRSTRHQVRWCRRICLGAEETAFLPTVQVHGVLGVRAGLQYADLFRSASLLPPSGQLPKHEAFD